MGELIVRELRLRPFDDLSADDAQPRAAAMSTTAPSPDGRALTVRRLSERHSRRRVDRELGPP